MECMSSGDGSTRPGEWKRNKRKRIEQPRTSNKVENPTGKAGESPNIVAGRYIAELVHIACTVRNYGHMHFGKRHLIFSRANCKTSLNLKAPEQRFECTLGLYFCGK